MDKMREEFEAYCKSKWPKHSLTFRYDLSYVDDSIEDAWLVWQASRQALVVELPNMPYYDFDMFKLQDALDDAGVRYVWVESESEDK